MAAGGRAQNLIFRAVCLDRERECPTLHNRFVKPFQRGPWFESDTFQDGLSLTFQFGVNSAFGYGAQRRLFWLPQHRLTAETLAPLTSPDLILKFNRRLRKPNARGLIYGF